MSEAMQPADYSVHLVVSETGLRIQLFEAIQKMGFSVIAFADGDSALEGLKRGELPHVLLADTAMTGLSGIGLGKRAKEISSEIEVILLVDQISVELMAEALSLEIHDYLLRSFLHPTLQIGEVQKVLLRVCEQIYLRFYNEFLVEELQTKDFEVQGLARLAQELENTVDLAQVIESGCRFLSETLGQVDTCFLQFMPKDQSLMVAARYPDGLFGGAQSKLLIPSESATNLEGVRTYLQSIETDQTFSDLLVSSSKLGATAVNAASGWKGFAFVTRGLPRGVFALQPKHWNEETQRPLVQRMVSALEKYFENALLHKRVFEMAIRDSATGLFNARALRERLDQELRTGSRISHPTSLLLFSIDRFKQTSDAEGSEAAEALLKRVSGPLKRSFRETDFVAHWREGNFCVVLPHTNAEQALIKADKVKKALADIEVPGFSVSVAVAEHPSHAGTVDHLLRVAEEAMERAQSQSQNLTVVAEKFSGFIPPFESKHIPTARAGLAEES